MTPMFRPDERASARMENMALLLLVVVMSLALGWVLWPFYGAILWGAIISLLFKPLYRRLQLWLNGRRTVAAALTLLVALLFVVLPFAIVTNALARQATYVYEQIKSGEWGIARYFHEIFSVLPDWMMVLLDRFGLANFDILQSRLAEAMALGSQFIATHALSISLDTFHFIAGLFISLYLAFFLIRDGDGLVRAVRHALPLAPEHTQELFGKFTTVIRATVKGNLLVAVIQGLLGGIAFWVLGVDAALLWAVLMAFLSLLPAVGAALVWAPVAAYFFLTGAIWQSVALTAYGVLVIGLVDNVLRPVLVGKDTRMPDYLVMITTLGGMAVFGINGFVIGPSIAAMFIAVWHIYVTTRTDPTP
jgi:predicted PurR-regulated permease PerM